MCAQRTADNLSGIFIELTKESEQALLRLKDYIHRHDGINWQKIYQYEDYIERIAHRNENLKLVGLWVISQICLHYYQASLVSQLQRYFKSGSPAIQIEVLKALTAVCETNSQYTSPICQTFRISNISMDLPLADIPNFLLIYADQPLEFIDLTVIVSYARMLLDSNPSIALVLLSKLSAANPVVCLHFTQTLLQKILTLMHTNYEMQKICIKIIGNFVVNVERSFIVLLEIKIFDYLLELLRDEFLKDILWIISNLVGEDQAVVEIFLIKGGFFQVFEVLNQSRSADVWKEVVFVVYNSCRVANMNQLNFFVNCGVLDSLKSISCSLGEDVYKIICEIFKICRVSLYN